MRDIEDAFKDETGRLLLSKTAVSQLGERLWEDYQAFAGRDLSEYEIAYLFVDGIPVTHRRAIRTTNLLERLFVEERRGLKIIPNAFGERAVLKLMFGALIRAAERWKSIKFTEFERRQMAAVKTELDQEYEAQVGLNRQSSKVTAQTKISSTSQT